MINPCENENREETGLEGNPVYYMLCGNCETRIGLKGKNDSTLYTCPNCGDLNEGNPNLEG